MRIYLSGKITGLDEITVKRNFDIAERNVILRFPQAEIVNPLKLVGYEPNWKIAMLKDIEALFDCTAIFMLSNWMDSKGAKIEHHIAAVLGYTIIYDKA